MLHGAPTRNSRMGCNVFRSPGTQAKMKILNMHNYWSNMTVDPAKQRLRLLDYKERSEWIIARFLTWWETRASSNSNEYQNYFFVCFWQSMRATNDHQCSLFQRLQTVVKAIAFYLLFKWIYDCRNRVDRRKITDNLNNNWSMLTDLTAVQREKKDSAYFNKNRSAGRSDVRICSISRLHCRPYSP